MDAPEKKYWMFTLFCIFLVLACAFALALVGRNRAILAHSFSRNHINCVILAHVVPSIAINVRRLRDVGQSG